MKAVIALVLLLWSGTVFAAEKPVSTPGARTVTVTDLAGLANAARANGQIVTMKPGVYRVIDYLPMSGVPSRRQRGEFQFLTFSGSNNVFRLDGVTIELDTALRSALRPPMHSDDFRITGESNLLQGLSIINLGDGTSPGGAVLSVRGRCNTLQGCTILVRGSFPYGYGDLFGKGGPNVINPSKHSGVHVTGHGTRVLGCKLIMRSFGHGFYVQQDASDVYFQDCTVEGVMRSTDEMLAETNGPAFRVGFRTTNPNRSGEKKIAPGYMKSLAEDGFRTYGQHTNLVFRNCTARNMRGGFELRSRTGVRLENCLSLGNERGFWISSGAVLTGCRGDAQFGPLLFVEGDHAKAELELLPEESAFHVHALATVHGTGHRITFKAAAATRPTRPVPILIGYGTPPAGEGMSPIPEKEARELQLRNETTMPVIIGARAAASRVVTRGPVQENRGQEVTLEKNSP